MSVFISEDLYNHLQEERERLAPSIRKSMEKMYIAHARKLMKTKGKKLTPEHIARIKQFVSDLMEREDGY